MRERGEKSKNNCDSGERYSIQFHTNLINFKLTQ